MHRVVVLAATPRSGSTMLSSLLTHAGAGRGIELLNPEVLERYAARWGVPRPSVSLRARLRAGGGRKRMTRVTRRSMREYLHRLALDRTTPNGVFTVRVMAMHLDTLLRVGLDLDAWGPAPSFVYLERHDRIAQAVSWHRAQQDGAWSTHTLRPGELEVSYDEAAIARRLRAIDASRQRWASYFAERSIEPVRVSYEDLDRDYEPVLRTLLDDLGFPELPVAPPAVARQRDELNEEWAARFRASPSATTTA